VKSPSQAIRFGGRGGVKAGLAEGRACGQLTALPRAGPRPRKSPSALLTWLRSSEDSCVRDFVMAETEHLCKTLREGEQGAREARENEQREGSKADPEN